MVYAPIGKYMQLLQLDIVTRSLSIATHDCSRYNKQLCTLTQMVHVSYCTQVRGCKQILHVQHFSKIYRYLLPEKR